VLFPVSRVRRLKPKKKRKECCFAGRMESFDSDEFGLSSLNNSRTMLWFFGFFCAAHRVSSLSAAPARAHEGGSLLVDQGD
jgi:hypothetical protein